MMEQISPTASTRYAVPIDSSTTRSFRLNPLSAYALQFGELSGSLRERLLWRAYRMPITIWAMSVETRNDKALMIVNS
jgi:hypothetical protein